MANFNKVILAGNLTRDPQLSYLPSNTPVAEFGLAINRKWRGQDGQMKEDTCFVDCRAYARSAETISQYVTKGSPILVEGRLQYQRWQAQDGTKKSKHVVVVEQFQFLGGRRAEDAGETRGWGRAPEAEGEPAPASDMAPQEAGPPGPSENDIPF